MDNKTTYYLADWMAGLISDEELKVKLGKDQWAQYKDILSITDHWEVPERNPQNFQVFKYKMQAKVKSSTFKLWKVAAILVLSFLSATYYWSQVSIKTAENQSYNAQLFDGTKIDLAPSSQLSYNKIAYWFNRNVYFKGNGFFNVIPGNQFTVENPKGTVKVLGTTFRIIDRLDYFKVSCYSGKVSVQMEDEKWFINPAESIDSYTKVKQIQPDSNSRSSVYLNFHATPLKVVLDEISKQYAVHFELNSLDVRDLFTGLVSMDQLEEALKAVLYPFNYDYKKKGVNLFEIYSLD